MDTTLALILDQEFSVSIPFETTNGVKGSATIRRKPADEVKSVSFNGAKEITVGNEKIQANINADFNIESGRWNIHQSSNFSRTDFDATLSQLATMANNIKTIVSENLIFTADVATA